MAELDAVYLPPAKQGDVYRATLLRPSAIGLVDGSFEIVPAVWHKEILWAMKVGIPVYGSASMGALRAAELCEFGMVGVGEIFHGYLSGVMEDDDEVAVVHGDAESNYRSLSDAMVNIRGSVDRAVGAGIISPETGGMLIDIAKGLFYPDRRYGAVCEHALRRGVAPREIESFSAWIQDSSVDVKKSDAREMLGLMRESLGEVRRSGGITFEFEHTAYWEMFLRGAQACDGSGCV